MDHPEPFLAILAVGLIVAAALAVVGLVLWHKRQVRTLLSRERLAALDKGVEIPWELDVQRPRRARRLHLKSGVIFSALGLSLALISTLTGSWGEQRDMLSWGIFFLVMGVANILYDRYVGKAEWERTTTMDEALMRAYIRRLEGSGARPHDASAEDSRDSR
jgi:hypothetical protein